MERDVSHLCAFVELGAKCAVKRIIRTGAATVGVTMCKPFTSLAETAVRVRLFGKLR